MHVCVCVCVCVYGVDKITNHLHSISVYMQASSSAFNLGLLLPVLSVVRHLTSLSHLGI